MEESEKLNLINREALRLPQRFEPLNWWHLEQTLKELRKDHVVRYLEHQTDASTTLSHFSNRCSLQPRGFAFGTHNMTDKGKVKGRDQSRQRRDRRMLQFIVHKCQAGAVSKVHPTSSYGSSAKGASG